MVTWHGMLPEQRRIKVWEEMVEISMLVRSLAYECIGDHWGATYILFCRHTACLYWSSDNGAHILIGSDTMFPLREKQSPNIQLNT